MTQKSLQAALELANDAINGALQLLQATVEVKASLDSMVNMYLRTALWSSNDESTPEGGEPFDKNYDLQDIAPESIAKAKEDCAAFLEKAGDLASEFDDEDLGHDFWLSRNGHGAGFFDGDYGDKGDELQKLAKSFGEVNPMLGDDGQIYFA